MAKIGAFDYPELDFNDAIDAAKRLAMNFGGQDFSKEALAAFLGYKSVNNGAFTHRATALRKYGILEGRGGDWRVTETAKRLAAPASPSEYQATVRELAFQVPLFKALFEQLGKRQYADEEFLAQLLNITKADRIEAQKQSSSVRKVYTQILNNVGYDSNVGQERKPETATPQASTVVRQEKSAPLIPVLEFSAGPIRQTFPFTPEGVDQLAMLFRSDSFWDFLKKYAEQTKNS